MSIAAEARSFIDDPMGYVKNSGHVAQTIPSDNLAALQLAGLQMRFHELRSAVPVLTTMIDEQGIDEIRALDDVVPLLFQHTVYKSYPVFLLEQYRFPQLTKWLNRLTVRDLGTIDVSDCDSIDSWIDRLCGETDLMLAHSSGTSGAMTFLPRTVGEYDMFFRSMRMGIFHCIDPTGSTDHTNDFFHVLWPSFAGGRSGVFRAGQGQRKYLAGADDHFHPLNFGSMSSDVVFLAGRLKAAAARGELDKLQLSPGLRSRRLEFEAIQRAAQTPMTELLDVALKLKGERILFSGTWHQEWQMAEQGLARGARDVFGEGSIVFVSGGAKGQVVPENWQDQLKEFTGLKKFDQVYGMTELTAAAYMCAVGYFHYEPWILPFVLNPDDGAVLPRYGIQTGRAAFYDLHTHTYWGGFITGDEISIDYSPCPCGQTTLRIVGRVERYSEKRGGDDKISCAASEEAHKTALAFLSSELT